MHEDILDSHGGNLSDQDATEGIGDRGIDADQREGGFDFVILVEFDGEVVSELLNVPSVVFSGPVTREVGRGNVCYCFAIDANNL